MEIDGVLSNRPLQRLQFWLFWFEAGPRAETPGPSEALNWDTVDGTTRRLDLFEVYR